MSPLEVSKGDFGLEPGCIEASPRKICIESAVCQHIYIDTYTNINK